MKKLIIILLLAISTAALSAGRVVDVTANSQARFTCIYPDSREDGQLITQPEIAYVTLFYSGDAATWNKVQDNTSACEGILQVSGFQAGQYYVTFTATDTKGRTSNYAPAYPFEVAGATQPPTPEPPAVKPLMPPSGIQMHLR